MQSRDEMFDADERATQVYRDAAAAIEQREARGQRVPATLRVRELQAYRARVLTFEALVKAGYVHVSSCVGAEVSARTLD